MPKIEEGQASFTRVIGQSCVVHLRRAPLDLLTWLDVYDSLCGDERLDQPTPRLHNSPTVYYRRRPRDAGTHARGYNVTRHTTVAHARLSPDCSGQTTETLSQHCFPAIDIWQEHYWTPPGHPFNSFAYC